MVDATIEPGTVISGRYLINEVAGSGGMATVYRAVDLKHERPVAVKVMQSALAKDPGFQRRFLRESEVVKRINSEHIVSVEHSDIHHHADGNRLFFFVTPLADGDLRDILKDARARGVTLPTRWILQVIWHVACGLDAAHQAGIEHGDVKPSNILLFGHDERDLDAPPHAEIGDFGIARADALTAGSDERHMLSAPYASPEQWDGYITAKGDQYSLACTLFEALCGAPPFGVIGDLRAAHRADRPPALSAHAGGRLPRALDPVLARALRRDPGARYTDCRTFVRAARKAAEPPPEPQATVPDPRRRVARSGRRRQAMPEHGQPPSEQETTPAPRRDRPAPRRKPPSQPRRTPGAIASVALLIVVGAIALYALTRSGGGDHPPADTGATTTPAGTPQSAASGTYDPQAMRNLRALIGYPAGSNDPCESTEFTHTVFGHAPAGVNAAYTCAPNDQQVAFFETYRQAGQADTQLDVITRTGRSVSVLPCQAGEDSGPRPWRTGTDSGRYVCLRRIDGGVMRSWDVVSAQNARMLVAVLDRGRIEDAISEFDRIKPKTIF